METGALSIMEDYIASVETNSNDFNPILRCLYTLQNILTCTVTDAGLWSPAETTKQKLNDLSMSLEASPSIVEKAMSVKKIIYSKQEK
jgi:hypothetical protein